jgi:hypothetical protein
MAIAIFIKNTNNPITFHKVFATQALVNEYGYGNTELYDQVTITDTEFNSIRSNTKVPESKDSSDNITWRTNTITPSLTEAQFKEEIQERIQSLKQVNEKHPSHSQTSVFNTYINYLEGIDTSSITFPTSKLIENYVSDQSQTFIHLNEIP